MDQTKLDQFLGAVLGDLAGAGTAALVRIGDRLGLYKALAGAGPLTSTELAEATGTAERYVREWLANQTASGYVTHDAATGRYELPDEHAAVLADETSGVLMQGGFDIVGTYFADTDLLVDAFRTGAGVGWHEHDASLYPACERFFRPLYLTSLVESWIPALDGVETRLEAGIAVADVGCGFGTSTVELAKAYPNSTFTGFDYHEASVAAARKAAAEAGVANRVTFEVAGAADYPGTYDLVCHFDALHDMGDDPVGAARHVRETLKAGGTWMLVEPALAEATDGTPNPVARLMYAGSTILCMPSALAQSGPHALGNQVGETRWRELLTEAGFGHIRLAAATPFSIVLELRA